MYASLCASCHGQCGCGDGPIAGSLMSKPPDFTDSAWLGGRSDEQIVAALMGDFTSPSFVIEGREQEIAAVIAQGAKAAIHGSLYMVDGGSRLSPQQVQDVVAYLKTFKQP